MVTAVEWPSARAAEPRDAGAMAKLNADAVPIDSAQTASLVIIWPILSVECERRDRLSVRRVLGDATLAETATRRRHVVGGRDVPACVQLGIAVETATLEKFWGVILRDNVLTRNVAIRVTTGY